MQKGHILLYFMGVKLTTQNSIRVKFVTYSVSDNIQCIVYTLFSVYCTPCIVYSVYNKQCIMYTMYSVVGQSRHAALQLPGCKWNQ